MNDDIFYISELYSLYKYQSPKLAHYCFNWRSGFFIIKKGGVITMRTIVIANNKGGVGKTSTSLCLAAGLREKKKKVLLIDLDAQENLRYACGVSDEDLQGSSLYEVFYGKANINNCLFQIYDNISDFDILIGGDSLDDLEEDKRVKEDILIKALQNLSVNYDYIVIDTPPALHNKMTKAALTAADDLIVPIEAASFSRQGLYKLFRAIRQINPNINVAGLLLTKIKENTNISKGYIELFQNDAKEYGTKLYKAMIHNGVAIPESQTMKQTIYQYAPNSTVAKDYMNLVEEYLKGVKKNGR